MRRHGAVILSSTTTVEEARWLDAHGVDAIIAQGLEADGHRGMFLSEDVSPQVGTFALLPQAVGAVNLPVIAAGGIADAGGVAAALALVRQRFRSARPARGIVNRLMRELVPINAQVPAFPLATAAIVPLRQAAAAGSGHFSPRWSGQNVSGCWVVPPLS